MTKFNAEVNHMIGQAIIEYAKANSPEWVIVQLNEHVIVQDAAGEEWVFDIEPARGAIEGYEEARKAYIKYIVPEGNAVTDLYQYKEPEPDGDWSYGLWQETGDGRV